ncbi:hypothetical protein JCM16303_006153 [Sporobolomyces ruberrimus]
MQQARPEGDCEEGGQHDFRLPDKGHSACYKCCCCPCWVLFSCFSGGGAQGLHGSDERPNEITCTKCGLNQSEASALSDAERAEAEGYRTSKGPNYFRTQAERINMGLDMGSPSPPPVPDMSAAQPHSPQTYPPPPPPPATYSQPSAHPQMYQPQQQPQTQQYY